MSRFLRFFLFNLFFMFIPGISYAGLINGKVTDNKKVSLPYATIYVQGTTIGSSAGADGSYELSLTPGTYKIVCQYIGFRQQSYNITIVGNETVKHDFVLDDESLMMNEVVIRANTEDPAYPIIRKAIAKRKFHLEQITTFQTDIYLKSAIKNREIPKKILGQKVTAADLGVDTSGKGILFLAEENATFYKKGDKRRTIIHSVRESGNPHGVGFSQFPPVISFYQNNVNLTSSNPRGFVSPISDFALDFYKYKLEGEIKQGNHTIYKIKVQPKRLYEPIFNGIIYIVDEDWAIHSLDVYLTNRNNLDLFDTLKVSQVYLPLQGDNWVIKNQVLFFAIKILGLDITASGVTVYNNQKVNIPVADTLFKNSIVSSYDKVANKKDTSYWTDTRPVALEEDEKRDYIRKDSIYHVEESPAYKDSIRRKENKFSAFKFLFSDTRYKTKENKDVFSLNPIIVGLADYNGGMLNYNIVEGLYLAPRISWIHKVDTEKVLHTEVAPRYGFGNTHLNAIGRVEYIANDPTWIGRKWLIGIAGGKYIFQYNSENPVSPLFNTVSALLWRESDLKIYERTDASVYVNRVYGNGWKWDLKFSYQHRIPLQNNTDFSFAAKRADGFGSNVPEHLLHVATNQEWVEHDAAIAHAYISYQPGFKFAQFPDYKLGRSNKPVFSLYYDKGIPDLFNSKVDYDKWRFDVEGNQRLKLIGTLAYNIGVGGFFNTNYVSIPDLNHLYGNRGIGFASGYLHSFQFAQYYDWSNKENLYGEAHLEYSLLGLLSNKIPVLRQARWYLVTGGNAFYAKQDNYYSEAFIGITNLGFYNIRLIRVDFVQSWDSKGGRNSGIRFGINAIGLVTAKPKEKNIEW